MVRRAIHAAEPRADSEVVLGHLSTPRVGAEAGGSVRPRCVQVVERRVEVTVPLTPTRHDWPHLLAELARQLDDGRVYDRDLVPLATALNAVLDAYRRRPFVRDRSRGSGFAQLW
jgi:cell division FtsZ-interacting protein ZapD